MTEMLPLTEFAQAAPQWRVLNDGAYARWAVGSYVEAAAFVQAVAELHGAAARNLAIDVRAGSVTLSVVTTEPGLFGMSRADAELAAAISALAGERGLRCESELVETLQLSIDALDIDALRPFWRAVLGYADRSGGDVDLLDPLRRRPAIWFQQMDEPRPQRNRLHVDVWVAPELVEARIAAALAAGGRLVSDAGAPMWSVLADPAGNEACVAAITGRG